MPIRLLLIAALLTLTLIPAAQSPTAAAAGPTRCAPVDANHRTASRVRTNVGCTRARRLLRTWLRRGKLPHDQLGWFCSKTPNVTCGGGNGGNAPYIRFRYRRH